MRVVVTAVGVVSSVGSSYEEFADAVLHGRSGGAPVTLFDPTGFPTRIAAEVKELPAGTDPELLAIGDRKTAFGVLAAERAKADAGDLTGIDPARLGVSLGTGLSSVIVEEVEEDLLPFLGEDGIDFAAYGKEVTQRGRYSPARHLTDDANRRVADLFGARGPSLSHFSACSASLQSIGWGYRAIRDRRCDAVIAGGQDSMVHPFGMISFMLLGALSRQNDTPLSACKPFDSKRDGFLMGEGAAMLAL